MKWARTSPHCSRAGLHVSKDGVLAHTVHVRNIANQRAVDSVFGARGKNRHGDCYGRNPASHCSRQSSRQNVPIKNPPSANRARFEGLSATVVCWVEAAPGITMFWYSKSSNCSRRLRNPAVLEFARLLATLSRFISWARIPVAAVDDTPTAGSE